LLLFPDGRLPSRRWRLAIYASAAGLVLQVIGLLVGDRTAAGLCLELRDCRTVAGALAAVASLTVSVAEGVERRSPAVEWVGVAGWLSVVQLVVELIAISFRLPQLTTRFPISALPTQPSPWRSGLPFSAPPCTTSISSSTGRSSSLVTAILAGLYAGSMVLMQRASSP